MKLSSSSLPRYSFNHSSGARGILVVAVGALSGRWSSFEAGCLGCIVLLSLLGGRGRLLGGCRPSWAAGMVCGSRPCVKWHEGDVVGVRMCIVVGRCVVVEASVVSGWWLLVEEAMSQRVTMAC